jgi:hypothetical protein
MLRPTPPYGRPIFSAGLERLGFKVDGKPKRNPEPGDVLLTWNRRSVAESHIQTYERAGCKTLVCENGYIGHGGPDGRLFALALGHHNGAGRWPECDDPTRWQRQGIRLRPWRKAGDFILLLPQRGIGERGVAMPSGWLPDVSARLRASTSRPIRVRKHPGHLHAGKGEPDADLMGAWLSVTHGSGAAIKALALGVPVFHSFPKWIGREAALPFGSDIERPKMDDAARVRMFERLAFAQVSEREVASGDAFARVLAA